jgi:hypothetical protein
MDSDALQQSTSAAAEDGGDLYTDMHDGQQQQQQQQHYSVSAAGQGLQTPPGAASAADDAVDDPEQQQQQQQWPDALLGRPPQQQQPEQPQSMHHGGSFRTYMAHKNLKLQEQFEMQALGQQPKSQLFKGVAIHVNGLTRPSHGELKQLMALHGGRFETYYYRDRVTHIVCSNLPDTKLKQLAHARWALVLMHGRVVLDPGECGVGVEVLGGGCSSWRMHGEVRVGAWDSAGWGFAGGGQQLACRVGVDADAREYAR